MKINKFILAVIFISFAANVVFADTTTPVVTSRKQSVEKNVEQQKNSDTSKQKQVQKPVSKNVNNTNTRAKKKVSGPISNANMSIERYNEKDSSLNKVKKNSKSKCKECIYRHRGRGMF